MMKIVKRFVLRLIWVICAWCLERIDIMMQWVAPLYMDLCREDWENDDM